MKILQNDTILVYVHFLDADQALSNEAVLGTVAMPVKNKHELIIPTKNNQVYFQYGTKLLHDIDGNNRHEWYLVKKSDILAEDTKQFNHYNIKMHS